MTKKTINIRKNPTKYKTILADPPWDIQQKGKSRGAIKHYNLMTLDRIKAMPISDLAEENDNFNSYSLSEILDVAT